MPVRQGHSPFSSGTVYGCVARKSYAGHGVFGIEIDGFPPAGRTADMVRVGLIPFILAVFGDSDVDIRPLFFAGVVGRGTVGVCRIASRRPGQGGESPFLRDGIRG